MQIPSSDLFTPLTLSPAFNIYSDQLDGSLAPLKDTPKAFGEQYYLGMPFSLGQKNKNKPYYWIKIQSRSAWTRAKQAILFFYIALNGVFHEHTPLHSHGHPYEH